MAAAKPPPLTIWAVSDGRVGIEAQVLGLAEAVARQRPAQIALKRIGWRFGLGRLPWQLIPPFALSADSAIAAPWPDIWIGAGRASLPLSVRVKPWSGGKTFVVQTQDPRSATPRLDLVVPPIHDGLTGDKVLPIIGAPNRMDPARAARDLARFLPRIEALPHPRVAMIVGGKSNSHDLPRDRARRMAAEVAAAVTAVGGSLLVSFTRRTPQPARQALTQGLAGIPGWIWDEDDGENPYFAFLAAADVILVTEDSTNLATDAATTGKPIHVLGTAGGGQKFERFHADLARRGIARRFTAVSELGGEGLAADWSYPPLDETNRAASELLRRFDAMAGS